jgi:hypothetical protein
MYGPAVRCKRFSVDLANAVLHQCIRSLLGAHCAPDHDGYQRACDLITGQASTGPFGSPVFACAGKTDSPSSSHPLADLGGQITSSIAPHFIAVPLFVPGGRSFVPACACRRAARKGPSRLAVAQALPLASMLPGHALTSPSTARGSRWTGRHCIGVDARKSALLVENRPRDAGELVGERNGEHVVV